MHGGGSGGRSGQRLAGSAGSPVRRSVSRLLRAVRWLRPFGNSTGAETTKGRQRNGHEAEGDTLLVTICQVGCFSSPKRYSLASAAAKRNRRAHSAEPLARHSLLHLGRSRETRLCAARHPLQARVAGSHSTAWPTYQAPMEAHWGAYLDGKSTRDDALDAILAALKK